MNGDLSIELAYFNSRLAVWEPLLEPVELVNRSNFPDHAPWSLHFEVGSSELQQLHGSVYQERERGENGQTLNFIN